MKYPFALNYKNIKAKCTARGINERPDSADWTNTSYKGTKYHKDTKNISTPQSEQSSQLKNSTKDRSLQKDRYKKLFFSRYLISRVLCSLAKDVSYCDLVNRCGYKKFGGFVPLCEVLLTNMSVSGHHPLRIENNEHSSIRTIDLNFECSIVLKSRGNLKTEYLIFTKRTQYPFSL